LLENIALQTLRHYLEMCMGVGEQDRNRMSIELK